MDQREVSLYVLGDFVAEDAVSIHYSEHPKVFDARKVLKHHKTVLVNLVHLGNEALAGFVGDCINYVS